MPETGSEGHVFRGRRVELQVASDGLALTRDGVFSADGDSGLAMWDEVAEVGAEPRGRRHARLVVTFKGDRAPWEIPGLPLSDAELARDLIQQAVDDTRRQQDPDFSEPVPLQRIKRAAERLLGQPGVRVAPLVDLLLAQAAHHGASDVHIEPVREGVAVRYRLDGVLHDLLLLPTHLQQRLLARLKVLAALVTYRRDRPQEGRFLMRLRGGPVDMRVSVLPTLHGEKATVRLFDGREATMPVDTLGFTPEQHARFLELISRPQGTMLLTGPSGSGKTTTMYSALTHIHERDRGFKSIATVEDPVEFDLGVINQTQVNRAAGLTFAAGLRTVLRQDPEVIMIGEIRDPETAEIAVQAGLTGHLVFSTVHARSAAGVFTRLLDMGVEPYLVASSVSAVLSQRLVRLTCDGCAQPAEPSADLQARFGNPQLPRQRLGAGCAACYGTGHSGRTGVFELLQVTEPLRDDIMAKASAGQLEARARKCGAETLLDAGLDLVRRARTTLEELDRVLGPQEEGA